MKKEKKLLSDEQQELENRKSSEDFFGSQLGRGTNPSYRRITPGYQTVQGTILINHGKRELPVVGDDEEKG